MKTRDKLLVNSIEHNDFIDVTLGGKNIRILRP